MTPGLVCLCSHEGVVARRIERKSLMGLRCADRATSRTKSTCNSPARPSLGRLPPRTPSQPAFWLSASTGAQRPLLAAAAADDERPPRTAARGYRAAAPMAAAAQPTSRLHSAASAPAPGRAALPGSFLDSSPAEGSLVRSFSDTVPSGTPCSPPPPAPCTRRTHLDQHRAVHRWLAAAANGWAASPGDHPTAPAADAAPDVDTAAAGANILPPVDRQRSKRGAVSEPGAAQSAHVTIEFEAGVCHVVCAGCSPLGRHALQPLAPEVTRPRLNRLLRARTCPEPLPPVESLNEVCFWPA